MCPLLGGDLTLSRLLASFVALPVVTPERMKARGRAGAQAPQPLCP